MRPKGSGDRRTGVGLLALALWVIAGSTAWGGASFDAAGLRALLAARGFSSAQAQAAIATLERARARQLPVSVLENRLREGLARRAAPATILSVLDERNAGLERAEVVALRGAGEGIGVRARDESLARLADAFSMGVPPTDVHALLPAAARAGRDLDALSRSAEVMGRLARLGFRPAETREVLQAALVERWTRPRLDGLVPVFAQARALGLAPGRTRELLVAGIRAGREPRALSDEVAAAKAASGRSATAPGEATRRATDEHAAPRHAPGAQRPAPQTPKPHTPAPHAPAPRGPRGPLPRPPMPHR